MRNENYEDQEVVLLKRKFDWLNSLIVLAGIIVMTVLFLRIGRLYRILIGTMDQRQSLFYISKILPYSRLFYVVAGIMVIIFIVMTLQKFKNSIDI